MPERDKPAVVAREWIVKAENDLKTAAHTPPLGPACPTDMRYPGPYAPVTLTEAKEAVKLARRVRREIRKLLEDRPLF